MCCGFGCHVGLGQDQRLGAAHLDDAGTGAKELLGNVGFGGGRFRVCGPGGLGGVGNRIFERLELELVRRCGNGSHRFGLELAGDLFPVGRSQRRVVELVLVAVLDRRHRTRGLDRLGLQRCGQSRVKLRLLHGDGGGLGIGGHVPGLGALFGNRLIRQAGEQAGERGVLLDFGLQVGGFGLRCGV